MARTLDTKYGILLASVAPAPDPSLASPINRTCNLGLVEIVHDFLDLHIRKEEREVLIGVRGIPERVIHLPLDEKQGGFSRNDLRDGNSQRLIQARFQPSCVDSCASVMVCSQIKLMYVMRFNSVARCDRAIKLVQEYRELLKFM